MTTFATRADGTLMTDQTVEVVAHVAERGSLVDDGVHPVIGRIGPTRTWVEADSVGSGIRTRTRPARGRPHPRQCPAS
jgi:hypothetical protein